MQVGIELLWELRIKNIEQEFQGLQITGKNKFVLILKKFF